MKYKELVNLLSPRDTIKISLLGSLGLCIIMFGITSIFILLGGSSPITLGGEEVGGIKGFLTLLLFMPLYFIFFAVMQLMVLGAGLLTMKLIYSLRKK
jgi:hypothetical protein